MGSGPWQTPEVVADAAAMAGDAQGRLSDMGPNLVPINTDFEQVPFHGNVITTVDETSQVFLSFGFKFGANVQIHLRNLKNMVLNLCPCCSSSGRGNFRESSEVVPLGPSDGPWVELRGERLAAVRTKLGQLQRCSTPPGRGGRHGGRKSDQVSLFSYVSTYHVPFNNQSLRLLQGSIYCKIV